MTTPETSVIERLRDELHDYHVDVQKLVQRCECCHEEVTRMTTDIYGLPGNKDTSPGLMGEVAELKRSGRMALVALKALWALVAAAVGAGVTAMIQVKF